MKMKKVDLTFFFAGEKVDLTCVSFSTDYDYATVNRVSFWYTLSFSPEIYCVFDILQCLLYFYCDCESLYGIIFFGEVYTIAMDEYFEALWQKRKKSICVGLIDIREVRSAH